MEWVHSMAKTVGEDHMQNWMRMDGQDRKMMMHRDYNIHKCHPNEYQKWY